MKINYPENIIKKSNGSNASEQYLNRLCTETFLSLWSYPNLFRDQGRVKHNNQKKGDGKELCDLLVVFENHIIIFSDKMCAFPSADDVKVNWSRWFKKAIRDSGKQIFGAERWIKKYPKKIFLDNSCQHILPVNLPDEKDAIFHRIVVAHGAYNACIKYFGGGTGSLIINTAVHGSQHWDTNKYDVEPFNVGHLALEQGFIHVLDDYSLGTVMQTLDTVSDFINYLTKKEKFLSEKTIVAVGEENLLANYLMYSDNDGRSFVDEKNKNETNIFFSEGNWNNFSQHKSRIAQVEANRISYKWDELIEKFLYHVTTGTSEMTRPISINEQEKAFRVMAKANRTERRALAEAIFDFIETTPLDSRGTRTVFSQESGTCYLFFLLPCTGKAKHDNAEYEKYKKERRELLGEYLYITKLNFPSAKNILGLAFETNDSSNTYSSEDFAYLDVSDWTSENEKHAREIKKEFTRNNLIAKKNYFYKTTEEYPDY